MDGTIQWQSHNRKQLEQQLQARGLSPLPVAAGDSPGYDHLLCMPFSACTCEHMDQLGLDIKELESDIECLQCSDEVPTKLDDSTTLLELNPTGTTVELCLIRQKAPEVKKY